MAMDMKWMLSAVDNASAVFDKVHQSGKAAADGIDSAFSGVLGKFNILTGAIGGLAAIAGGMMFKSIIDETVNWEISVGKLGATLGMTTAQASVYAVAAHTMGIDMGTVESAGLKLAKTLGTNEQAIKSLGVETRDSLTGNLRSTADLMPEVNQKLGELKAGTDRNVIAMQIYGRSWNDVRALLKINNEVMDEARETATRLHLVIGDEGVAQAKEYKKNLNEIGLVGKSLSIQLGNVLLPMLIDVGSYMGKNAPLLAETFGYALQFVGKTAMTLGEYIGLITYRIVTLASAAANLTLGNFAAAKKDWQDMVAAGNDFDQKQKARWTDWGAKPVKSKAVTGDTLDLADTSSDADASKYATDIKAYDAAYTQYSKAFEDNRVASIKASNKLAEDTNQLGYDTGLIDLQTYLTAKHDLSEKAASEEIASKQKLVNESKVLFDKPNATDMAGGGDIETQAARMVALTKLTELQGGLNKAVGEAAALKQKDSDETEKMTKATLDGYAKVGITALESAGLFEQAELAKQELYRKSTEYLKLEANAMAGSDAALVAMGILENSEAVAKLEAAAKSHDAATLYAADIAKMTDEIALLNGADKIQLDAEGKLRDGLAIEAKMRSDLVIKTALGDMTAIAGLNSKIGLQDVLNARLQTELDLIQRKGVLTGAIVGFNGNTPIYANGYANGQAATGYVSNSQAMGATAPSAATIPNSPFVGLNSPFSGFLLAKGINNVPYDNFPAILHKDESVVPAKYNSGGSGGITFSGGIQIAVQGGDSAAATVDEIARQLMPKLDELARRRRAA